jgi:hypothetical protein
MQPIEVKFFSQFCDIRDLAQKNFSRQTLSSTRIQTFCQKKGQDLSKNDWLKSSHIWSFSGMEVCLLLL